MVYRSAIRAHYDAALHFPSLRGRSSNVHGHRYTVEAVVEAETLDEHGFVVDFDVLQPRLEAIAAELDHQTLNELAPFRDSPPSAERQAEYFFGRLSEVMVELGSRARLAKVRITQEPDAWAEYEP